MEKMKGDIESQRERKLKRIADEALKVYETLTDQMVYKAFRVNKDDYSVEVSHIGLRDISVQKEQEADIKH